MTIKTSIKEFIKKEIVLCISVILALLSSIICKPKLEYIDFKVLILLFNLMIIVATFNKLNVLDSIASKLLQKCTSYRTITITLITLTFVSSMFVTNDVALITFVPLTLIISKKVKVNSLKIVILQTLAANLGSAFTPMGNPQNLYLYSYFNISPLEFFKATFPLIVLSIVFLAILILKDTDFNLNISLENINCTNKIKIGIFSALFIIVILSVFHIIDYKVVFLLVLITVFTLDKKLFMDVDYSLLITFIGFFIFVGNISSMEYIKVFISGLLSSKSGAFFTPIILSQGISNVPAAMLLSGFTEHSIPLLLGVNIGGLGTLIASMASVISYKLYIKENEDQGDKYLKLFTLYNIMGVLLIGSISYFLLIK